jgi:hypothetical protein
MKPQATRRIHRWANQRLKFRDVPRLLGTFKRLTWGRFTAPPAVREESACEVTIDDMSLVVQNGAEQLWDWRVAGTAPFGANGSPGPGSLSRVEPFR